MQNEKSLEGWMFINYIALCWYYKIYSLLVNHKLINKVSVNDILQRLSKINKVRINSSWVLSEITAKTNSLIKTLGVTVT